MVTPPRSTRTHCGSAHSLAQRVDQLPSVALDAGYGAPLPTAWKVEAVVGLFSATFVPLTTGATTRKDLVSMPTLPWPSYA